ncbi:MAG TPA: hypothetical protein DCQ31_13800 [Bacteroidales bacterium]|nr:hypothetical protein [Bacteroidales bacterium]
MSLLIRKAVGTDAETISNLGKKAFTHAFGYLLSDISLRKYLNKVYGTEKIAESLAKKSNTFWIAELENTTVAFLKMKWNFGLNKKASETEANLQHLYVNPDFTGQRIGETILKRALEETKERKTNKLWLEVFPEGPDSLRFFIKQGFAVHGKYLHPFDDFELEYDVLVKHL